MYAAIRQYKPKPGMADQLAERVRDLVPVISGVSGFMGYYVIYAPDDVVTAISIFNKVEEALQSNALALEWVAQNLSSYFAGEASATAGPVIVHSMG